MVNNDDDGLWGLLKINMNMRVYRERQRRDKDCVFILVDTYSGKGFGGGPHTELFSRQSVSSYHTL